MRLKSSTSTQMVTSTDIVHHTDLLTMYRMLSVRTGDCINSRVMLNFRLSRFVACI